MIETILKVDGMMCGMCESHVNETVRKTADVKKVTSSHTKGETVILSEQELDIDALKAAIVIPPRWGMRTRCTPVHSVKNRLLSRAVKRGTVNGQSLPFYRI